MDPLRIITKYNTRRLSETLISSFLNYFLDPLEDHGFGYTFLAQYFQMLGVMDDNRKFWSNAPSVGVLSEQLLPNNAGRIDSVVWVRQGKKVWVVATEVKIHDSSAKNQSAGGEAQLDRYFKGLESMAETAFSELVSEEKKEQDQIQLEKAVFVYLVPAKSRQWRREVREFCTRLPDATDDKSGRIAFKILPWAQDGDPNSVNEDWMNQLFTDGSLELLIRGLLEDQSLGSIQQPDDYALHLLRCIRYAAINDFRYVFPSRTFDPRFPSHEQFEGALKENDQWEVFVEVMASSGVARKANPLHTTLGIPITIPKTLSSNSLLAIRTTASYANPEPLGAVEIEFDTKYYGGKVAELQCLVEDTLKVPSDVFMQQGLNLKEGVHPDANEANANSQGKVFLLRLEKGDLFDSEQAAKMLTEFFSRLRFEFFNVERSLDDKGNVTFLVRA